MHELSIATRIVDVVKQVMDEHSAKRVGEIKVEIGKLSCVDPASLRFCFEAITAGSELEGAHLNIGEKYPRARCHTCGSEYEVRIDDFRCRDCGSDDFELLSGSEILVTEVEVE